MKLFPLLFLCFLLFVPGVHAQQSLPDMPEPLANLAAEGAQVRYLGRERGLDGWIAIKQGQESYFYVMPDGKTFVMGLLFDETGQVITVDQVRRLQEQDGGALDALADDFGFDPSDTTGRGDSYEFKSPSEQLYFNVENANWVPLGQPGAPIVYAFIDPQCGHCHAFVTDIKDDIEAGRVQLRMVMVGFKSQTQAQAAYLLAAPDPQKLWFRHLGGDSEALPVIPEISQQGVQRNLAIMQSWKFTATPMIVYRAKDGSIKIVRGRPQDADAVIADLGART